MAANSTFSISNFKTAIGKPVRPNLFKAVLSGWDKSSSDINNQLADYLARNDVRNIDEFSFRCEKAEFPGRTLATSEDTGGGGPTLKLPYDVTYNDIQLSIICSADMKERLFFESWMDSIIGPAGMESGASTGGLVSYFQHYARGISLEVQQLNEAGEIIIAYTMHDIYPTALSAMNATWEEVNSYQRFGVTLFYRHYTYVKYEYASLSTT
jgi:hypothetical protein